jgi:hypothetical protein
MFFHSEEMLQIMGRFLESAAWLVRGVTFDGHLSNNFFREALRGHFTLVREEHLKEVPFFKDVTYENVPQNGLPRLPMKICCFNGTPVWGLQGSCSLFVVERLFIYVFLAYPTYPNLRGHFWDPLICAIVCYSYLRPRNKERSGPDQFTHPGNLRRKVRSGHILGQDGVQAPAPDLHEK